jgi:hypothetical protein
VVRQTTPALGATLSHPIPLPINIDINLGRWTPSVRWSPSDLTIYNSLGECVMNIGAEQAMPLQRIDISGLPPGVYFIKIRDKIIKFVKII